MVLRPRGSSAAGLRSDVCPHELSDSFCCWRTLHADATYKILSCNSCDSLPSLELVPYSLQVTLHFMQRLIARILFLTALLGTFVPVAAGVGVPLAPHACCIRKSHSTNTTQIQGVTQPGNCCPPRTPSLWAAPVSIGSLQYARLMVAAVPEAASQHVLTQHIDRKSARAPPAFSIA